MDEKFGKSFAGYKKMRGNFFDLAFNKEVIKKLHKADLYYRAQQRRTHCKICDTALRDIAFKRNNVVYFMCYTCEHLNGGHEDTPEYCSSLYVDDNSDIETSWVYQDATQEAFDFRVSEIYLPKAEYIIDVLRQQGEDPLTLRYADVGAGAGHMVKAMHQAGLSRTTGFDVDPAHVALGNRMMGKEHMTLTSLEETIRLAETIEADVVVSVFMLEHVQRPREWCKALKRNPNVKYALIAVPMFSPTVVMELTFPNLMNRSLGEGHTHLFTEKSLEWLFCDVGMESLSHWWFGADAFDFHRFINCHLRSNQDTAGLATFWDNMMEDTLDGIQLALDKCRKSSEVHCIVAV